MMSAGKKQSESRVVGGASAGDVEGSRSGDTSRGGGSYTARGVSLATRCLDMALAQMHAGLSARMDVTVPELLAVAYLGMEGAMGPSELARRLHMTTGAMTALVDRLSERGYLVREAHPSDRRRLLLNLTEQARRAARVHVLPMADEVEALAASLSEEDRQKVGLFLDDLVAIVRRYPAP